MKSGRRRFYWDAAIFIAWLQDEKRPTPGEREGIAELAQLVDRDQAVLVTSAITRIEVLNSRLATEQQNTLDEVLRRRRNVQVVACDPRVADKSHQIRDHYLQVGRSVKTPDAIHLATAIIYEVDVLYSLDGKLLALDGDVAGHRLRIEAPRGDRTLWSIIDDDADRGTSDAAASPPPPAATPR